MNFTQKCRLVSGIAGSVPNLFLRLLLFAVMITASAGFCSGCGKKTESHGYKVVDSGAWDSQAGLGAEKTFWLDDENVLFNSSPDRTPGTAGTVRTVTIWNTSSGKIVPVHANRAVMCVKDKQLLLGIKDRATNKTTIYRGSLENPKEHPMPNPEMKIDDIYDCDWVPLANPNNFPHTKKLRGNNHFKTVEPKTDTSKGKVFYYEHLGTEGKEHSIYPLSYRFTYSEFLDAYMVDNGMYDPSNPERGLFRILERNGNLRDVPFPQIMLKGRQDIYPLKNGYLSDYRSGKYTSTDPGDHGLWLLQGENAERLIVGAIHGVSISPNGCKVAFIHARNSNEYFSQKKPYRTVKYIDFCKGETRP